MSSNNCLLAVYLIMAPSILKTKSYGFAVRIVNLYKTITSEKKEFVLSKQLLRSGTAIGALVAEANYAQSKGFYLETQHCFKRSTRN